jgi:hypothetical protein
LAEEEILHVAGDEFLRLLLPRHEPVLVEDHLHPLFPHLPGLRGDVLVDPLPQLARPRRCVQSGEILLKLHAVHRPAAFIAGGRLGRSGCGIAVGHRGIVQRLCVPAETCRQINGRSLLIQTALRIEISRITTSTVGIHVSFRGLRLARAHVTFGRSVT